MLIINNQEEYEAACTQYESVKYAEADTEEHKLKMELVAAIVAYEDTNPE